MQEWLPQHLQPCWCEVSQIVPEQPLTLFVLQVAALGSTEQRNAAEMRHRLAVTHSQSSKHSLQWLIQA
jgi:hypothetical protein